MAPVNTHSIGKVFIVHGTVKAVSPAGVERILTPNSPVYAHEHIVTGPDGSVSIALADHRGQLDLGRMSDVLLDEDVYGGGHAGAADAVAEVRDIQAALENSDIDPTTDLPGTAAGPGVSGTGAAGGGRHIVIFDSAQMEVLPDSGADTTGVGRNFLDPPPGGLPEDTSATYPPDQPPYTPPDPPDPPDPPITYPTVGGTKLVFNEAHLPNGSKPIDNYSLTKGGSLADLGVDFGGNGPGTLDFGNGQTIVIDGSPDTPPLVVTGDYGTLTINSDGSWTYTWNGSTLDHGDPNATGWADQVRDPFTFDVIDSNGNGPLDGQKGSLLIHILDDGPVVEQDADNASLSNGGSVTGDLHINFGADGPASDLPLQLGDANGDSLDGKPVVDAHGNPLTSGGQELVYEDDGSGGVRAVNEDGDTVFSVSLDPDTGTYTITMEDTLDSLQTQTTTEFSSDAGLDGDNNFQLADITVHVTGTYDGDPAEVQWDENGIGVHSGEGDEKVIGPGDELTMSFQDGDGNAQVIESIHVTLTGLEVEYDNIGRPITEEAQYTLYLDGNEVGNGTIPGQAGGQVDLDLQWQGGFDTIVFSSTTGKGSTYQIKSVTVTQEVPELDLSYTVLATDGDGDSVQTAFQVTIETTDADDGNASGFSSAQGYGMFEGASGYHAGDTTGGESFVAGSEGDHDTFDHLVGPVDHH